MGLRKGIDIAVHTHVNHAQQVTPLVGKAVRKLLEMGFRDVRNQGVLLRGVNKRAGVDDDGVGLRVVVRDFNAVLEQRAEHDFGVHQIFGATERNQADPQRAAGGIWCRHRRIKLRKPAGGVENYLPGTVAAFVSVETFDGVLVEMADAGGVLDSAGRPSCVRITARMA